jgi:hypothetical protein
MTRERLPNRGMADTFGFECNGLRYACTVGRFHDGRIAEVFITNTKPSLQSDVNARDAGIAASLALQVGCSLETLQRALLHDPRGKASSPLGAALDQIGDDAATGEGHRR